MESWHTFSTETHRLTDATGALAWEGGLSPFGTPYTLGDPTDPGGDPADPGDDLDDPNDPPLPPPPPDPPPPDNPHDPTPPPPGDPADPGPPDGRDGGGGGGGSPAPDDGLDPNGRPQPRSGRIAPQPARATLEELDLFLRLPGQWEDAAFGGGWAGGRVYYNVHRWYRPDTGRYARPDPLGEIRPDRKALFTSNHLYAYAAGAPTFFVDPLGLKVVIENPKTQGRYDQLKECFPLFRNIAEHFENDTWTSFGPDRTWTVKDPNFEPSGCMAGGSRSEARTIWVPPGRSCEGTMRCLMHEFYELWLIRVGGYPQSQMGAGPADEMARRFEQHIPMERCCPCD